MFHVEHGISFTYTDDSHSTLAASEVPPLKSLGILLLLLTVPAFAKKHDDNEYAPAVLTAFHVENSGSTDCTTRKSQLDGLNGPTVSTSCSSPATAHYVITIAAHDITLVPDGGWEALTHRESALYGLLPGAKLTVRIDGASYYVRVGKRESRYRVVAMQ